MSRILALALSLLLAQPLSAHATETPETSEAGDFKPVVAVLYFDNNTGQPALDVLKKGFADMMVTDLSAVRQLQVVEREKLQKLLDELKLQRSGYFDSKTVQRIGQGIGAQFAVTGSLQAVDPSLRIDIRLVEIATGKVLLAEKVIGKKNRLFDLQQQLVGRFVKALLPRIDQLPRPRSRAPDVDTLLSYSKGIDLADQGKLQEASVQLASVVSQAPTFLLARERHEEFLSRLKGAEQRRTETLTDVNELLGQQAERFLREKNLATLGEQESSTFLAWRLIRMQYLARQLRQHLAPSHPYVMLPGHEPQALALMKRWHEQARAFVQESTAYVQRFSQEANGTRYMPNTTLKLPPEDEERVRQAKYGPMRLDEEVRITVARTLLLGRFEDGADDFQAGPSLSDLEPSVEEEGFRLLEEAVEDAGSLQPRLRELRVKRALELHGDALMRKGRVEEAITRWQRFLDLFPASDQFNFISNKIKTALGVGPNAHSNAGATFPQSLEACDKRGILEGYGQELNRRLLTRGYKAARELFVELDTRCGESRELKPYLRSLLTSSALSAAQARDCATFHELMTTRFLALNGSQSDIQGYLKNYVPHCRKAEPVAP
ncbi:CsgG/HfaB family protein [Archangium sp.]|uniref:CsgG/HfaB family protein n=1 Tax=Archangium sp. TaxID=1872627 RepID=UPI002D6E89EE|nr:CsgG/HfaB family protein [Archangium sp.]HYO55031.1 CsgG/HfaB family protein [Archangium sp.]